MRRSVISLTRRVTKTNSHARGATARLRLHRRAEEADMVVGRRLLEYVLQAWSYPQASVVQRAWVLGQLHME
jgi:hypothetical protein